jgi:hypothetical protein
VVVEHDDDRHTADAAAVSPTFPCVNVMVSGINVASSNRKPRQLRRGTESL